jgi:hypothetical protein
MPSSALLQFFLPLTSCPENASLVRLHQMVKKPSYQPLSNLEFASIARSSS